jgi:hypothetical protein
MPRRYHRISKTERAEQIIMSLFNNRRYICSNDVSVVKSRHNLPATFALWNLIKRGLVQRVAKGTYECSHRPVVMVAVSQPSYPSK